MQITAKGGCDAWRWRRIPPTSARYLKINTFEANVERTPRKRARTSPRLSHPKLAPSASDGLLMHLPPDETSAAARFPFTRLLPPPLPTKTYANGTLTHTRTRSSPRRSWLDRFRWFCFRFVLGVTRPPMGCPVAVPARGTHAARRPGADLKRRKTGAGNPPHFIL